jgi:hypothetical protein
MTPATAKPASISEIGVNRSETRAMRVCPLLGAGDKTADAARQLVLQREGLDDSDALRCFLHGADKPRVDLHRFARGAPYSAGQIDDGVDQRRPDQQRHQGQHRILPDHDPDQRDQRYGVACHRCQRHRQQVADAVDVLVDLGGQPSRARVAEETDAELHQMSEDAALVAGHQIVADSGQCHGLAVGGQPAQHEGAQDRHADQRDEIAALLVEDLVDDILHDPGGEGGRGGNRHQAQNGQNIVPAIVAAVLGDDAADHRHDLAGPGFGLVVWRLVQVGIVP